MRRKFVVGNWKLNGGIKANSALVAAFRKLYEPIQGALCGICAPSAYLQQLGELVSDSGILAGAQDASRYEQGAYTGEVSAAMLADLGMSLCIVGHSERRALFGDTDEVVAEKFGRVKAAGLTPILCVGETLAEREGQETEAVILRQLDAVLARHGRAALDGSIVAYEPVWAIGTGKTASKEQAQAVHAFIRARLAEVDAELAQDVPILYGGSVKAVNAGELFSMPDVDGGLVGGASLNAEEFAGIWGAVRTRIEI